MEGELKGLPKPFKFEKMWPGMRTSTLVLWLKILGVHTLEALPFLWRERRSKKQRSWTNGIENGLAMYNRGLEKWEQLWKNIQTQQPSEHNVDCFRVYIARLLDCIYHQNFICCDIANCTVQIFWFNVIRLKCMPNWTFKDLKFLKT